uniref:Uncharacterized protein n=1 Tax=Dicentrarchus labrax TaxID=13489 RepID=A0A8P4GKU8_DICLA
MSIIYSAQAYISHIEPEKDDDRKRTKPCNAEPGCSIRNEVRRKTGREMKKEGIKKVCTTETEAMKKRQTCW